MTIFVGIALYLLISLITFVSMSYWAYIEQDTSCDATVLGTALVWPIVLPLLLFMTVGIYALPLMFKLFEKLGFKA